MKFKIVSDSSSNILSREEVYYSTVPLKIITDEKEYVDNLKLNVSEMVSNLKKYKGKSGSSCPNMQEWLDAFDGAENIFAITISSNLSGSYTSARQAGEEYIATNPNANVFVIDSLSTGPEMHLIIERLCHNIEAGKDFEEIKNDIIEYQKTTHLLFGLQSLTNLARNGRVNPAIAKVAGILGIRILGVASEVGTLQQLSKHRSDKKLLQGFLDEMESRGFKGGKVKISHCFNEATASALQSLIIEKYPNCDVFINPCTGLCSFYAEEGGILVGFEG